MANQLLTPAQIEAEYGYSRASVARWRKTGALKATQTPGGQYRYAKADLDAIANPVSISKQQQSQPPNNPYKELGTTGLSRFGGSVQTEELRELQGSSGRKIYREMRFDPVISAMFFALIHSLKKASKRIEPASEKAPDRQAAEHIDSCFDDMSFTFDDTFTFMVEPTFEQGFSVLELVYKKRLGEKPGKYTENPATSKFNDGKVGWRKWSPRPAESLLPGSEWIFDDYGGIQGINQYDLSSGRVIPPIPIEKLLHFRTTVYPANTPEPPPIHRAAYIPWYYTTNLQEVEAIGIERDLNGMPVVYLGNDRSLSDESNSDYTLAKNLVTNIRMDEQMGVVLPGAKMGQGAEEGKGWLLELLTTSGARSHDTSSIIERYDKRKAIIILAQFIMLGMDQVGSYALSRSQNDMFILAATSWLNSFADIINRHAIPRLMNMNAFPGITGMPQLVFSPLGIPDLAGISDYVNKLVDKQVLKPDEELERHLRQLADLPQKAEPEEVVPTVGETAAPSEASPTGDDAGPANLDSIKGLNGAQITAALDILAQVGSGAITPVVGTELLVALGLDQAKARLIIQNTKSNPSALPAPVPPPKPQIEGVR